MSFTHTTLLLPPRALKSPHSSWGHTTLPPPQPQQPAENSFPGRREYFCSLISLEAALKGGSPLTLTQPCFLSRNLIQTPLKNSQRLVVFTGFRASSSCRCGNSPGELLTRQVLKHSSWQPGKNVVPRYKPKSPRDTGTCRFLNSFQ